MIKRIPTHTFPRAAALLVAVLVCLSGCLGESVSVNSSNTEPLPDVGNTPPTISGDPAPAVLSGNNYSFTPNASDADGDPLTFSVANLPVWASFNPDTGQVSGQPLMGDLGTYSGIVISVSDGQASASLSGFEVTVSAQANGSVTLSWTAPLQNTDGSSLTDLAGYRIYYGIDQGLYTEQINIDNPSISSYVVENLVPDTYYFVATSLNTNGIESSYSNVAIKIVEGS